MRARAITRLLLAGFLGIVYVFYGLVKLAGGQFHYGEWVIDSRTTDGPSLVWAFYGWSPLYGRFIGLTELAVGLLLLWPRTRTLGALALLPIVVNITVLDFCFGFPSVKYFALAHLAMTAALLATDLERLKPLWARAQGGEALRVQRPVKVGASIAALVLVLFFSNLVLNAVTPGPEGPARALCAREGFDEQRLVLRRSRMSGASGIDREGEVDFVLEGSEPPRMLRVRVRRASGFVPWRAIDVRPLEVEDER